MNYLFLIVSFALASTVYGQSGFETDPAKAEFITTDIPNFWKAFDQIDSKRNPFRDYLNTGSDGLKDFIPHRIESAKNLLKVVKKKKADYTLVRDSSYEVTSYNGQIREAYHALKDLYPQAVFPPTYFVIGAFNSGGTSTDVGLIIGVEMQVKMMIIPYIVAHELIHFNQHYDLKKRSLLKQSIMEGSADLVGEFISGGNINKTAMKYGDEHTDVLCKEFVEIMHDEAFHGWLYGSKGKKEGRPNDLGYWMGYRICEAYYNKASDKKQALYDILNIQDFNEFLSESGYLSQYIKR